MSDPFPPEYRLAHVEAIYVTASPTTVLSDDNKITGLDKYTHKTDTNMVELKQLNSDGWSRWLPTWKVADGTFSGQCQKGSATQAVLRAAALNNTLIYVTTIDTPSAAVGAHKGWRRAFWIQSDEVPREAGNLVTFNYPLKQEGAPVELLGTAS